MAKIKQTGKRIIAEEVDKKADTVTQANKTEETYLGALNRFVSAIEVEEEISYKNLKIFPLHLKQTDLRTVKLKTLDEALKEGILEIQETGVVSNLKFINKSKIDKILIVEGDIVQGGRQNRVVNITMILDEDSEVTVPTSCVEQGRWHGSDIKFKESAKISPTLYTNLNENVYRNYENQGGSGLSAYASNQGALWEGVSVALSSSSSSSSTGSFSDAYVCRDEDIKDYLDKFEVHIKSCCGIAAAIGKKIVVSIADSAELFMPTLKSVLKSYILEALSIDKRSSISAEDIVDTINDCVNCKTDLLESPNKIGQIVKLISPNVGSAFLYKDNIVHIAFVRD